MEPLEHFRSCAIHAMASTVRRSRLALLRITFTLFAHALVHVITASTPSFDKGYERYRVLFAKNEPAGLRTMASELGANPEARTRHLGLLCAAFADLRSDRPKDCLILLDSLEKSASPGDSLLHGAAKRLRAMVSAWFLDWPRSLLEVQMGLRYSDPIQYPREHVDLLVTGAEALQGLERTDEALQWLSQAQRISAQRGYDRGHCLVQINLGNLKYAQERYTEAWEDYLITYHQAQLGGFEMLAQNAVTNLGSAAVMLERWDDALLLYDSLILALGDRSPDLRSKLHNLKGLAFSKKGEHLQALEGYRIALSLKDRTGDLRGRAKVAQHMSGSLWKLGRTNEALQVLRSALENAQGSGNAQLEMEIRSRLANWYEEIGQCSEALENRTIEMDLSDSLNQVRFGDRLAFSEVQFETAQKERRIAEQDQALALAAAEDRRKSIQRNALIGATALLVLIAILLYRTMRSRQRLAQKDKDLHNKQVDQLLSQQELKSINAMLEGQEKERDRMGKDLHDRLGSMLGGIKANMAAIEDRVEQMRQDQQYQKVNKLLDQTVGELRQISHDMAAATLSRFGLEKALKDLRDTLHISGRMLVELKAFGLDQRLERSVEIALYRIVQELVSNVLKHAKANELTIGVTRAPGRLSVVVSDNGAGFDPSSASGGMGLSNVRSRATAIGATMQVDSVPGKGTTVSVECVVVE